MRQTDRFRREREGERQTDRQTDRQRQTETETETETETDRQTDRQTDRRTDGQTDRQRQTDRQTDREGERPSRRNQGPSGEDSRTSNGYPLFKAGQNIASHANPAVEKQTSAFFIFGFPISFDFILVR